jgi:lipoprotein-releasing system ATP-binding protein
MAATLVEVRGVTLRFWPRERTDIADVLAGVDLDVQAGESVAIVGPSGSGKSTLLNVIGGLLPPTAGSVRVGGRELTGLAADELAALRNRSIGFVFQSHHLLPQCTALENVLVPTLVCDRAHRAAAVERARALLLEVGLGARLGQRPSELSGGECQRVAVVRALINQPVLLLADEPTGSLDARAAEQLGDLLCELNERQGTALVTVTHSERLAARMQRVLELSGGRLAPQGAVR